MKNTAKFKMLLIKLLIASASTNALTSTTIFKAHAMDEKNNIEQQYEINQEPNTHPHTQESSINQSNNNQQNTSNLNSTIENVNDHFNTINENLLNSPNAQTSMTTTNTNIQNPTTQNLSAPSNLISTIENISNPFNTTTEINLSNATTENVFNSPNAQTSIINTNEITEINENEPVDKNEIEKAEEEYQNKIKKISTSEFSDSDEEKNTIKDGIYHITENGTNLTELDEKYFDNKKFKILTIPNRLYIIKNGEIKINENFQLREKLNIDLWLAGHGNSEIPDGFYEIQDEKITGHIIQQEQSNINYNDKKYDKIESLVKEDQIIKKYYIKNKLAKEEFYSQTSGILQGLIFYFYENNLLKKEQLFQNGKLTQYKIYTYENGILKTAAIYNDKHFLLKKSEYYANGNFKSYTEFLENGYPNTKIEYYDIKDKIKSITHFFKSSNGKKDKITFYENQNLKSKITYFHPMSPIYKPDTNIQAIEEYDTNGKEMSKKAYFPSGKIIYEIDYYKNGNTKTFKQYFENGLKSKFTDYYEQSGLPKKQTEFYKNDKNSIKKEITYYNHKETLGLTSYWPSNIKTHKVYYENGNLDFQDDYNENKALIREQLFNEDGNIRRIKIRDENGYLQTTTKYEYDANKNVIRRIVTDATGQTIEKFIANYDNNNHLIYYKHTTGPNNQLIREYTAVYDNTNHLLHTIVTDENGNTEEYTNTYKTYKGLERLLQSIRKKNDIIIEEERYDEYYPDIKIYEKKDGVVKYLSCVNKRHNNLIYEENYNTNNSHSIKCYDGYGQTKSNVTYKATFNNNQIISETAYDHSNKLAYEKTTDSLTLYDFYKKPIKQKVYSKNLSSNSYKELCEKFNKLKQKALTYVTNEIDISDKMPWRAINRNKMTTQEEFKKYIANKFNIEIE